VQGETDVSFEIEVQEGAVDGVGSAETEVHIPQNNDNAIDAG